MDRLFRNHWRVFVGLGCGAALLASFLLWERRSETIVDGIAIRGNERFIQQVSDSLVLLREKAPDAFALSQQYMKRIEQSSRSGMRAYAEPPTFDLAPKTAFYSTTWCAGSIAHDTYHSKLYHEYLDAHGEPVPDDAWGGQAKELECIHYQSRVLKDIGAPEYEMAFLDHLDGTHYDLDGDGNQTWIDYWLQDW